MLTSTTIVYDKAVKFIKYVQTLQTKADKEARLATLVKDSIQEKAARADFEEWLRSDAVVTALSMKKQYDALTDYERDIITLGTGNLPSQLDTEDFAKAEAEIIKHIYDGSLSGKHIRDFVKVAADLFGTKIKAFKDEDATLVESFNGSRFTGFRVSKGAEPIKTRKRSDKQWTRQLALYLYASAITSVEAQ